MAAPDRIAASTIVRIPYTLPPDNNEGKPREGLLSVGFDESFTDMPDDHVGFLVSRRESGGLQVRQNKALAAVGPDADNVLRMPRAMLDREHLGYDIGDAVQQQLSLEHVDEEGLAQRQRLERDEEDKEEQAQEPRREHGQEEGRDVGHELRQELPLEHRHWRARVRQLGQWLGEPADRVLGFLGMATVEENEQARIWRGAIARFVLLVLLVWLAPRVLASIPDEVQMNLKMIFLAFAGYMFVVFGF